MAKITKGRQKVEMTKIENEINLQVTFSKRRYGLFKKASEFVSLCGAEVGLVVFSPGDKVYTFGHPNVQSVICRYLSDGDAVVDVGPSNDDATTVNGLNDSTDDAQRAILAVQLGQKLTNKESLLENEKKIGEIMDEKIKNSTQYNRWSKLSIDELNESELFEYKAALERLKTKISAIKLKKSMEMMNQTTTLSPPKSNPFFEGGNNNFDDPYFGHNNLNTNDENFLPPFGPSFSSFLSNPNHNLGNGEESSSVEAEAEAEAGAGATTFVNSSYPPP